ncbi:MAG: complex I NDUFA9 subunit family protein [Gammaproteobacteria bacterium]
MALSKKICILGATGFVGQHIVGQLAKYNHKIKIISRHRERKRDLLVLPSVEIVSADVHDPQVLKEQLSGQDVVINLVGILNESGKDTFERVHVELAKKIADACIMKEVPRVLHMSALKADADNAPSKYLRSKGKAEDIIHKIHTAHVTSFRPSVIFGPRDSFFNRFAKLLRIPPRIAPFPLAVANARFAPVYAEDVAKAFATALDHKATFGQRYDLCGPNQYTLEQLVRYTAETCGIKKPIIPLGNGPSRLMAMFMGHAPGKPFTKDNYLSSQVDSICEKEFPPVFGIVPTPLESIVPTYLGRKTLRDRFSQYRRTSRRV